MRATSMCQTPGGVRHLCQLLLVVGCLVAAGCNSGEIDWDRVESSVTAPDFKLTQLDGGEIRMADLRGRVVVMEFWATWCRPCQFSTPTLDGMYRKYRDRGVTMLLVNAGEEADKVRWWVDGRFEAPVLMDSEKHVARLYGVNGIPRLFVVDQEGQIVYHHAGYTGGFERNLKLIFKELLEEDEDTETHG